ncbi:hypothetical protein HY604_03000 [Candidatus Peregrinibacteria bacterium]|nr:hypothetical protein [Candidatus Peregrinibacteria bacterium]
MADPNEGSTAHDLPSEPERSKLNAEGWTDAVDGKRMGAAMILQQNESTSARVDALMAQGKDEEEAKAQAIAELEQTIEGKTADVETYIRLFAKVALTPEEVKSAELSDPTKVGSKLPFVARAMLYQTSSDGETLLRYGAKDGSIKEVTLSNNDIASVRQAIADYANEQTIAGYAHDPHRSAREAIATYRHIKASLKKLGFRFEHPPYKEEHEPTGYDMDITDAIHQKRLKMQRQEADQKRAGFDF